MTLDKVKINSEVIVKEINCTESIKRRILDLGIIDGTKIKPVLKSPLGDPTAYEVRGMVLSLREEDSQNIEVQM